MFNYEKRLFLQEALQKKVTITRISQHLGITRQTIYRELKTGLSEEDLATRKYRLYDAELAQKKAEDAAIEKVR